MNRRIRRSGTIGSVEQFLMRSSTTAETNILRTESCSSAGSPAQTCGHAASRDELSTVRLPLCYSVSDISSREVFSFCLRACGDACFVNRLLFFALQVSVVRWRQIHAQPTGLPIFWLEAIFSTHFLVLIRLFRIIRAIPRRRSIEHGLLPFSGSGTTCC